MTRYEYFDAPGIDRIIPVIDEGDPSPGEAEYAEAERLERERLAHDGDAVHGDEGSR